ncbi:MAG: putative transcriptional regulator, NadR family [Bacillales bacterium]|jgi:HTH-type transcriptional repressor of NAD biosynthesis genes|nr:putative transcriptional regulator, NadR family [Bacillales bacterium]
MKNGIILGKFMPLHLGHEHLINTAIASCDHLTIVVCTLSIEPIPGHLRFNWMKQRYTKEIADNKVNVVHLREEWMPQDPDDCYSKEIFYAVWAATLKTLAKEKINAIFTSEYYGYPVAKALECEHILVDVDRKTVPVSGTKVRNNPDDYLKYLNPEVRKYFTMDVSEYDKEDINYRS